MAKRRTSSQKRRARRKRGAAKAGYQFHGASEARKRSARRRLNRKAMKRISEAASLSLRIAAVALSVAIFLGLVFFAQLTQGLPSAAELFKVNAEPMMTVLDASGAKIGTRGLSQGAPLHLSELPRSLVLAVLAVEDKRFYRHVGIDVTGLARAAFANWQEGHVVQGGSTISQQLAKILFLSPERTYKRKLQEALLALWLEHKLTKDEILEIYLNRVYLGAGTYGVEAAAQRYFGKSARRLSLVESALLAGLLKAPSRYAPTNSIQKADERTSLVLDEMVEAGFITPQERAGARREPARIVPTSATAGADYILDWIIAQLPDYVGKPREDLIIETSIELRLQRAAEAALESALAKEGSEHKASEGALVAMTPQGAVLAMVGGRSYAESSFNRAVEARRPPGSAFKPFVYAAAIESGLQPGDVVTDEPFRIGKWQPANYTGRYLGAVTLESAFAQSINTVAARLGERVGRGTVVSAAQRFGIASPLQPVPSLALGSQGVGVMELTGAYAPFANGGGSVIPHGIQRILTKSGKVIYERTGQGRGRAGDLRVIGLMNRMLTSVVETGTGRAAQVQGQITAGKTGTGQDHRDAWFVGFTAYNVAGVWIGNDDFSPMKDVTGGTLPAKVFKAFMTAANEGLPTTALPGTWQAQEPVPEMPVSSEGLTASVPVPDAEERGLGAFFSSVVRTITGRP